MLVLLLYFIFQSLLIYIFKFYPEMGRATCTDVHEMGRKAGPYGKDSREFSFK